MGTATAFNFEQEIPEELGFYPYNPRPEDSKYIFIENSFIKAAFDRKTGLLKHVYDHNVEKDSESRMHFMAYKSHASGAYLFYPSSTTNTIINAIPKIKLIKGPYMEEIHVDYDFWSQSVKLYDTPRGPNNFTRTEQLYVLSHDRN